LIASPSAAFPPRGPCQFASRAKTCAIGRLPAKFVFCCFSFDLKSPIPSGRVADWTIVYSTALVSIVNKRTGTLKVASAESFAAPFCGAPGNGCLDEVHPSSFYRSGLSPAALERDREQVATCARLLTEGK